MTTSEAKSNERERLPRLTASGERPCWVTVIHNWTEGRDLVIGAATKQSCLDAFDRLTFGAPADPDLVSFSAWRKLDVTGYGFACFRAAALSALNQSMEKNT